MRRTTPQTLLIPGLWVLLGILGGGITAGASTPCGGSLNGADSHARSRQTDSGESDSPAWIPPLAPPLRLTGTFGEYRRGHLHTGIDLSTYGETGWPVSASVLP